MELRARVTVGGADGLHTRPVGVIAYTMQQKFPDRRPQVVFRAPPWSMRIGNATVSDSSWQEFDPFSALSLIMLGGEQGTVFEVVCAGDQAQEAYGTLRELFTGSREQEYFTGWIWEDLNETG
jgi:phosphotransferase system HPr-like phosphotransfer protein